MFGEAPSNDAALLRPGEWRHGAVLLEELYLAPRRHALACLAARAGSATAQLLSITVMVPAHSVRLFLNCLENPGARAGD